MKIFSSFVITVFCICILSCQKKSDPPAPPTKTDHISASAWKYQRAGLDFDKNGTIEQDLPAGTVEACRADNLLSFRKDGTGTADEGATKCNAADMQSTTFNWSFADNEASLNISGNSFPLLNGNFKIITLTATDFSLSKETMFGGQNITVVVNFKH